MTEKSAPADERSAAESVEGETRGGGPDVIYLPDQSQPEPPRAAGRHTGRMKGRHFGPRPVDDPLDAWLPPTRCTAAQRAAVEAAASEAGLSLNAYQRKKLCGSPGPRAHRAKPGPDMILMGQVKAGQGRIGGNLQQFVKRMNSYDFRGQPELLALRELAEITLREHREASAALMLALGGRSVTDDH